MCFFYCRIDRKIGKRVDPTFDSQLTNVIPNYFCTFTLSIQSGIMETQTVTLRDWAQARAATYCRESVGLAEDDNTQAANSGTIHVVLHCHGTLVVQAWKHVRTLKNSIGTSWVGCASLDVEVVACWHTCKDVPAHTHARTHANTQTHIRVPNNELTLTHIQYTAN